jgi:hypothetical protein
MDSPPSSDKENHDMEKECIGISKPASLHATWSAGNLRETHRVITNKSYQRWVRTEEIMPQQWFWIDVPGPLDAGHDTMRHAHVP